MDTIFLVGETVSNESGALNFVNGGYSMIKFVSTKMEGDITQEERSVIGLGASVFSRAEEEKERNKDHIDTHHTIWLFKDVVCNMENIPDQHNGCWLHLFWWGISIFVGAKLRIEAKIYFVGNIFAEVVMAHVIISLANSV